MRERLRPIWALLAALLIFGTVTALPANPAAAADDPTIIRFWLVDATTDTRLHVIEDYDSLHLPVLPEELSIEAEANGNTSSVIMRIEGVESATENNEPYALAGGPGATFNPVPELTVPGWLDVSAQPFSGNNGNGTAGTEVELTLYIDRPDFFVDRIADYHDDDPGDGRCTTDKGPGLAPNPGGDPDPEERDEPPLTSNPDPNPGPEGGTSPAEGRGEPTDRSTPSNPSSPSDPNQDPYFEVDLDPVPMSPPAPTEPGDLKDRPEPPDPDGGLGLSGCTLRAAIEEANALPGPQRILVDGTRGIYELTKGQLVVSDSVTLIGHERPHVEADSQARVVYIYGASGTAVVSFSSFELAGGSPGANDRGGNVFVDGDAIAQFHDSIVRNGTANYGGGLYVQNGGHLRLVETAVHDNLAGSEGGGGVTNTGGGLFNLESYVEIDRSSFYDNTALRAGAVGNSGGTVEIDNSMLIDNEALTFGGAIRNKTNNGKDGKVYLNYVTIAYNQAGAENGAPDNQRTGGGIYNSSRIYMANTILAANTDAWWAGNEHHSPDCWSQTEGDFLSYRHNLIGVLNDNCFVEDYSTGTDAFIDSGTEGSPLDPELSSKFLTGSHLAHRRPNQGSPAIDVGSGQGAAIYPCPDTDMRGNDRPVGAGCDIGGSERQ